MKQQQKQTGITVFYSYASADSAWCDQLAAHLSQLKREGLIGEWSDQQILAGSDRAQEIGQALHSAHIILLLISADFLASDACYQTEMQQALERHRAGVARVIPIIVRPCDWEYSPFAHLQCLPRNNKPITIWDNQDEAFVAIVQELRKVIAQQQFPFSPLSSVQSQNRTRLLKRVRTTWIEGLLDHSLHQAAWMDFHLQEQTDALENPWRFQVQELDHIAHALPEGTSIVEVFDEANGELLILGEPGSGKTTLLLQLARTLLNRAGADERQRIPIVFNLSSWVRKEETLATWLVGELKTKYQVPSQLAQHWVEANQILPLLDGLDEVAAEARVACMQAIIAYSLRDPDQPGTPLVVCCRSEEYQALSPRLRLQRAVRLLPLTDEQIDGYFSCAGSQLGGLRHLLRTDARFAELPRTPLMLNVLALAFQGKRLFNFPSPDNFPSENNFPSASTEQILQIVFATYVQRMLTRRGQLPLWMQKHFLHWLIGVARQLHQQQQTMFSLEDLQLDWLPKKRQWSYLWSLRVLGILFSELVFGLSWLLFGGNLVGYLTFGLFMAVFFSSMLSGEIGEQNGRILRTEVIRWSWKGVHKNLTGTSVAVLFGGLFLGLVGELIITQHPDWLLARLAGGLLAGLLFSLMMITIGLSITSDLEISLTQLTKRSNLSPNEGIRRSVSNGLLFGGLCGGLALLTCGLINEPPTGLFLGLFLGLGAGLIFGLNAFIQHFVLRFWLWRTNCLPWNLVPFLDEAAERLLLRKVGGSYIFVHRLLLEYFATLDEAESTEHTPSEGKRGKSGTDI